MRNKDYIRKMGAIASAEEDAFVKAAGKAVSRRKTCAGCPHLKRNYMAMNGIAYSCAETGYVIPHASERREDHWDITFWRVPLSCPLPDDQVHKSEDRAPERDWVKDTAPLASKEDALASAREMGFDV